MLPRFRLYLLAIALIFPLPGHTAPDWGLCTFPVVSRQAAIDPSFAATDVEADSLFSENKQLLQFSGEVRLTRASQSIAADRLEINRDAGIFSASGNLSYSDQLFSLNADRIRVNNQDNSGVFDQADFQLYENHLRGTAYQVIQLDEYRQQFLDVSYTTCDPQRNTWSLNASRLKLDHQDGRGTAHHAVLWIKDIPVFYFPWLQFPIDDRRMSGLLSPILSHSTIDGTQLALPFYWNIAENYDMTISPHWYSERGLQLNTENRYLLNQNSGELQLSWLDDELSGEQRWYGRWQHEAELGQDIDARLQLNKVSDTRFLQDFNKLSGVTEVDYLKSSVTLNAQISDWSAQLLLEEYQLSNALLTPASVPYRRLPRLTLDRKFTPTDGPLSIAWNNEWVQFEKDDRITGARLHIAPVFSYPLEDNYYFIKPAIKLDYTRYSLDNNKNDINSLERSLPLLSLDSGLIFERVANVSRNWLQTLEPRLYLLYVPHEDQSTIPLFDSALLAESYANLFTSNRFSGADRVGDSQQLSLGITSRLLGESSNELVSASIGQAFYAAPRKVSVGSSIDQRDKSSLMTVINIRPEPSWNIQLASVYDQSEKESKQTDVAIRHHSDKKVFNLEYHLRHNELEQSTVSVVYPVSVNWSAFAKQQHSIKHDKPVQNLFGLAYESCCWGFKILYDEYSDDAFKQVDRSIYFQLTLKGLSSAGRDINAVLEDGILGYQPVF